MARNKTLHLDLENKKFLGVCAGLARYLDVEPWTVRIVFIACVIFGGWFLIPLYFAAWFLLDDSSKGVREAITDNLAVKHFRTVDYRKKIYRNTRDAKWAGVCAGIADYLEVNVFAVRILFVLLFFTAGGFPLLFYLAAWMVLDKAPESYYQGYTEPDSSRHNGSNAARSRFSEQFGEQASARAEAAADKMKQAFGERKHFKARNLEEEVSSKRKEIKYCARKFSSLQHRLARMEAYVTSSRFKLHREFRNI